MELLQELNDDVKTTMPQLTPFMTRGNKTNGYTPARLSHVCFHYDYPCMSIFQPNHDGLMRPQVEQIALYIYMPHRITSFV